MNDEYLEFAKELAHEAGEILLEYFQTENIGLDIKEDSTPVTIADTEVNSLVVTRVKERFLSHGVLGEEDSFNLKSSNLWVVDPLDGTSDFARGLSGWVFSMAYVEEGTPKVAVVYDPILRRLLWAVEGEGAYENERKLDVSGNHVEENLEISSWVGGGKSGVYFKDAIIESEILAAYTRHGGIFAANLPVAHALALAGTGRIHAAVSSCINPWDLTAGGLIAKEAGAKVTNIFGESISRWDQNIQGVLAAAPAIHGELLQTIMPVLEKYK